MNVLLLEPPPTNQFGNMRQFGSIGTYKADIAYPPIDLMKIAGALRLSNIDFLIYDANTLKRSHNDVLDFVKLHNPKFIVMTTSTTALKHDMALVKLLKKNIPDTIIATFGAHIKGAPTETMEEFPDLDVAIYGDQEFVAKSIIENKYDLRNIKGIVYRANNKIIENPAHQFFSNLDDFGIAAHDSIDKKLYKDPFSKKHPLTITYGQTGCINKCTYCMSQLYSPVRKRSVEHFLEELKFIKEQGFKEVFFIDCGITNDHAWANKLFEGMLSNRLNLSWWGLSRADKLNEQILNKMKETGCHSIGIGVESANKQVIKNINKKVDTENVKNIIKMAHRIGLRILLYFQFGLPGETMETMEETLKFALESNADLVTFGIATPVPGTAFYNYIRDNNYFITKDWNQYDPMLPPVYDYPNLSSKEIYAFSRYAYKKFYFRPKFILKRFLSQRSFRDFKKNIENSILLINNLFSKSK